MIREADHDNESVVRILCHNMNHSYAHVDTLLERNVNSFDVLFLQEPPWRHIRATLSSRSKEGEDVVSALRPLHQHALGQPPHLGPLYPHTL